MPKIRIREDGTGYIYARIHPEKTDVRCWEVTRDGVEWLHKQGIGDEQEMGRGRFLHLRELKYAYIANSSGKRSPTTRRRKPTRVSVLPSGVSVELEEGPNGTRKVITVPARLADSVTRQSKKPKKSSSKTSAQRKS